MSVLTSMAEEAAARLREREQTIVVAENLNRWTYLSGIACRTLARRLQGGNVLYTLK